MNDFFKKMSVSTVMALGVLLSGCKSMPERAMNDVSKTANAITTQEAPESVDGLRDTPTLGDAALTPLEDINLRKAEIPPILLNMENPYVPPLRSSCIGLTKEIKEYDALLGADFDDAEGQKKSNEAMALNAASSLVGSLIPFRGLVRTASGAASYDKEVERAYRKGVARRGYLKGLRASRSC